MAKIRIVIVDDEVTSRNTIKGFLEGNELYEVTADFSDGKRALDWLRCNEIDILLCDMQMPEMNGVELMRAVHVIDEFLPVIAVSAYDDFAFVRGSLINGAANYLLKHELTGEKLIQVLNQVREKYQIVPQDRVLRHKAGYFISDRRDFTADNIRVLSENGTIDFVCTNVIALAVSPDYVWSDQVKPRSYKEDICRAIIDILGQILGKEYHYLIYRTSDAHLILLLSFPEISSTLYVINTMKNLINRLKKQVIRLLDLTLTIVNGDMQIVLEPAIEEAFKMERILRDKFYFGGNRVLTAAVTKPVNYSEIPVPDKFWKQLRFEMQQGMNNYMETLNDILSWMEEKRMEPELVNQECTKLYAILTEVGILSEQEKGNRMERIQEYELFEDYKKDILELYAGSRISCIGKEKFSPLVEQAVEYIRQNFSQDISLEKCAELTGSSYSYLSREFKQESGMRFVEFLNRQRVNRAKSLLIRKDCTMKEIVEQAGFRNYNYFFKVFKEIEGLTPSEFVAKN